MYTAENKTQLATDRKTITQMKVTFRGLLL